jgi:flagellar basal-body rod protein FlgG
MRALYAAATGMGAQQTRIDNVANNLANINTTGFKKSRAVFQDLFYQELVGASVDSEQLSSGPAQVGAGVRTAGVLKDHSAGHVTETGNALHLAIDGNGYFGVEAPSGELLYTRDGSFTVDPDGYMITTTGLRVSGDIQISNDITSINISEDGTVVGTIGDDVDPTVLGQVEIYDFNNRSGLRAEGGNMYSQTEYSGEPISLEIGYDVSVVQGFLEGSNVDVAEELINMIMAQRAFEMNSKVIQAADETLQQAVNLRR